MSTLAVQRTNVAAGLVPIFSYAAVAGDVYPNTGAQTLQVRNLLNTPITVTITAQNVCSQGSLHTLTFVVAAGATALLGPFAFQFYNDATGNVNVTYSATMAPGAAPVVVAGAAGLPNGTYPCQVTFVVAGGGETAGSAVAVVTVANQQIAWSAIPLGPAGTTARKLYRNLLSATDAAVVTESAQINAGVAVSVPPAIIAPVGTLKLVTTIADNTTTTFTDNVADGALGAVIPVSNTAVVQVAVTAP